jgi:hypothetical protein
MSTARHRGIIRGGEKMEKVMRKGWAVVGQFWFTKSPGSRVGVEKWGERCLSRFFDTKEDAERCCYVVDKFCRAETEELAEFSDLRRQCSREELTQMRPAPNMISEWRVSDAIQIAREPYLLERVQVLDNLCPVHWDL